MVCNHVEQTLSKVEVWTNAIGKNLEKQATIQMKSQYSLRAINQDALKNDGGSYSIHKNRKNIP